MDFIDYRKYSLAQLYDARRNINKENYPDRFAELEEEIKRKEADSEIQKEKNRQKIRLETTEIPRTATRKGLLIKAIFVGCVIDVFGGFLTEFVFPFAYNILPVIGRGFNEATIRAKVIDLSDDPIHSFFNFAAKILIPEFCTQMTIAGSAHIFFEI